jgi:dienelactone hydrolase
MAEVLLFHHAQGLTSGVREFAQILEAAGHVVHTPDLYDGHVYDDLEAGIGYAQKVGFGTVLERGEAAVEGLPAELVYAGFSLGVMPAQKLAQTRPGAIGAVLMESCLPPEEFGGPWPAGVPVQIHGMDADPYFAGEGDVDAARGIVESVADAELFLYPGDRHLFADRSLGSYDEGAALLLTERVLGFLAR